MKTRYKYIQFAMNEGINAWCCRNNKSGDVLGWVEYYKRWKQWIFSAEPGTVFSIDCLADIQEFMKGLEK